ncbi:MAG: alpha/beta hydrolase [Rickettsiales bacterium]|nr:alpha/beta hydrolase [Rickettsiales bacterium]
MTREVHEHTPVLLEDTVQVGDGSHLHLKQWLPKNDPRIVLIGLHGFNDYSQSFALAGDYLSKTGIAMIAFDQRGFGNNKPRAVWPGYDNLIEDVHDVVHAVRRKYPDATLYLLGESMGGAVAINATKEYPGLDVEGVILSAPALWARETMPMIQRFALWFMVHTFPASEFTGEDLGVLPSDNIDMLRAMAEDPNVIKKTRVDSMYGIVNLMDEAFKNVEQLKKPVLLLYGAKDEVIPKEPVLLAMQKLSAPLKAAFYPDGYHMLLRDLKRHIVLDDIASWVRNASAELPSGYDMDMLDQRMALAH